MSARKFYVVWVGHSPGIYDSWEEAKAQVDGFPGARYRSFTSQAEATKAFRGDPDEAAQLIKSIARHAPAITNLEADPNFVADSIAVDGACAGNPGVMEYRGVDTLTGAELFHFGPVEDGTNNVAEYLALIHALALFDRQGNNHTSIYTDSVNAMAWIRRRGHKSKLARTPRNAVIFDLLERADHWIQSHPFHNPVLKWDTKSWGEIPADFGRK